MTLTGVWWAFYRFIRVIVIVIIEGVALHIKTPYTCAWVPPPIWDPGRPTRTWHQRVTSMPVVGTQVPMKGHWPGQTARLGLASASEPCGLLLLQPLLLLTELQNFMLEAPRPLALIITMAQLWGVIQVGSTTLCMVQWTHLITTGGTPHLYNRGSSMQASPLHSGANDI